MIHFVTSILNGTFTSKNLQVVPPFVHPYLTLCWLGKSLSSLIVSSIPSLARKAARLAVYDEIMMRVKNHHMPSNKHSHITCVSVHL